VLVICPNPAFDTTWSWETRDGLEWSPGYAFRASGGKGANVARALRTLGVEVELLCLLPRGGADEYEKGLVVDGVRLRSCAHPGRIRETLRVLGEQPMSLREPGPHLDGLAWEALCMDAAEAATGADRVVISGSFPSGIVRAQVEGLMHALNGHHLTLDSSAPALGWGMPFADLIAPNHKEIAAEGGGLAEAVEAACQVCADVVITLGGAGAIRLRDGEAIWARPSGSYTAINATGAGDAFLAGLVAGDRPDWRAELAYAVAAGELAAAAPASTGFDSSALEDLACRISVEEIDLDALSLVGRYA